MNKHVLKAAAVLPAILALASCSAGPGERTTLAAIESGKPGGVVVDTYQVTATVTGIDKANRKVTLVTRDGHKSTVKVGPEVVNFPQIAVGDHVKTTFADQVIYYVRKPGEPARDGVTTEVARARKGAKPHAAAAETTEMTAKVTAIDLEHHKATLRFPDGSSKTLKVRNDVDLTKQRVGAEVTFLLTSAVAIKVEKP
jgi:hypothetical protein